MEDVRATLDWMGTKSIFSTFDLKDVGFQVELAEDSRDFTAIRTVIGLLRYVRLPQGLKNSPAVFQRTVNTILGGRKGRDVWAFMDDISLGTCTAEVHLDSLRSVLDTLLKAGARLKLSKCNFGVQKVEVLGHKISPGGMTPCDIHVQAIKDLAMPQSGEDLMRFLGLTNYFAQFVDHFAELSQPLYAVLKGTGFNKRKKPGRRLIIPDWDKRWDKDQQRAWMEIKNSLSSPELLLSPRRRAPKHLLTDASGYGTGGVLLQQSHSGLWRPIEFTSRKLTDAEVKYTVTERECLAIVHGPKKWKCYLHGGKDLDIETDHLSLKWLMSLKDPRGRLARWMVDIQDYEFCVRYVPGLRMTVPDVLSRDAVEKTLCQRCFKEIDVAAADGGRREHVRVVGVTRTVGGGPGTAEIRKAQREKCGTPSPRMQKGGKVASFWTRTTSCACKVREDLVRWYRNQWCLPSYSSRTARTSLDTTA